jgi:hypothetical protein
LNSQQKESPKNKGEIKTFQINKTEGNSLSVKPPLQKYKGRLSGEIKRH